MNIQQQNGIVSTINVVPYVDNDKFKRLRVTLFDRAIAASHSEPTKRIDVFDESILIFDSHHQALNFLLHVFRAAVVLAEESKSNISLRSSLCEGSYFVHQDQIYGDAVNLATTLSCTSRENELRVCGFDKEIIDTFVANQSDVICFSREEDQNCVSLGLLDMDCTQGRSEEKVLQIEYNYQSKNYETTRNRQIRIGRSHDSDLYIVGDHISRNHATIILNYDNVFIEDHSSNGTFVYIDDREIFVTRDKIKLPDTGFISCGLKRDAVVKSSDIISFRISEQSILPALAS